MKYAPANTQAAILTSKNMDANTALILQVKMKKVKSAKPQTSRYTPITALYPGEASPVGSSAVAYGAPSCSVGSWSIPKDPQKTANRPMTIIGKKLPMIHSKTMAKIRSTGPTKKKMPLLCCARCRSARRD